MVWEYHVLVKLKIAGNSFSDVEREIYRIFSSGFTEETADKFKNFMTLSIDKGKKIPETGADNAA